MRRPSGRPGRTGRPDDLDGQLGRHRERVGETVEDLKAYLVRSRTPQWYADKIVAWFAGGATPSPYTLPAWHGETESWWVGSLDEARS
ncbi:hypothetical protein [Micromonospora sp. HM5-17]|uniref:hypothetical protein n=1 Tax=Micromonospora sp. HM5-17 TaxID=2487710 RepID=UPI000F4A91CF|nr:hypothetical protein [Micromonospora sp. HM5-17]ROT27223.1 hypothetical protein EF879_23515 [Micromonospora sp. HM5-17]